MKVANNIYNSKADLWKAIKTTMTEIEPANIKKWTKSMDNRLLDVIEMGCKIFKDLY